LFLLFSINSFVVHAQPDFKLVDSLIQVNSFPILYSSNGNAAGGSSAKYKSPYTFIIGRNQRKYFQEVDTTVVFNEASRTSYEADNWDSIVFIPKVHLVFFYASVFRRKDNNYRYLNFFIDHFIKNSGDNTWAIKDYKIDLKLFKYNTLIKRTRFVDNLRREEAKEGWVGTGLNEMDYEAPVKLWNHFDPNLYSYTIEVLDRHERPYEYFNERIGFRDIRLIGRDIWINNNKVRFKTAKLASDVLHNGNLENHLRELKVNNFNSITINTEAPEILFDLCDSIGLFVIQELRPDSFHSLPALLDYFVRIKDNPSFIVWNNSRAKDVWVKIIKRLDQYRPILHDKSLFEPTVEKWITLSAKEKTEIKNRYQIFDFYFIPDTSVLSVQMEEPFRYLDNIELNWRATKNDSVVVGGVIKNLKFEKGKAEIKILTKTFKSPDMSYEFELVITADIYPFKKGDVIALSKFQYILQEGKLIYKTIY
jgi:hypothetical protein